jgi:S-DNA-T family DNA segregation ATPase FtsK/SpoIIIE
MFLGKDVSGKPVVIDMCKMPHLLIAGRTGTGKSVCLNTLILSMLLTRSPEQVKMLMIDPKMVELSPYSRIPHLMHPVITDMKKAEAVLGWAVDKMEERYDLLARVGVRHLDSYNQLGKDKVLRKLDIDPDSPEADQIPESMPYIVIIADEMADMMMTSGKDVEGHIIRLAQKSRAVGIHLVLATQKPTVDVITGLIKSNLPARISFQVASRMDSRVVLDEMGADKLLGNGDLLYMAPGTSTLRRAQGTYVSDDEVNRVIEYFADSQPEYDPELMQLNVSASTGKGGKGGGEPRDRDDLYEQAVEVVIREGRGSVSLLQRALGVGYGRGARMIDWMAEDGIVGTYNGSQAREVVMTMEQWEEMRDMAGSR